MVYPYEGDEGRYPTKFGLGLIDFGEVHANRSHFTRLGGVLLVLGILAILLPFAASLVTTVALGCLMLIAGVVEGIHAIFNPRWGGSGWGAVSAVLYVVAGALVLGFPIAGKTILTLVLAAFLMCDGILKVVRALQHRAMPAWGWLCFDGALAFILGIMIWVHWPSTAVWALGLIVGVDLAFNGISLLLIGLGARPSATLRP